MRGLGAAMLAAVILKISGLASTVIPIPMADSVITETTPVPTIVDDGDGYITEKQYVYDPNENGVVIDDDGAIGVDNASLFFPMFSMGFLWWDGYWVNHNGYYWNGHKYVRVKNVNWDKHWRGYWNETWTPTWKSYWDEHRHDENWPYKDHPTWKDQSGEEWLDAHGGEEHSSSGDGHSGGHGSK